MLNSKIEKALNEQLKIEAFSSQYYLAIASWAENKGLNGTADFFYQQSDEERTHMLRVLKFINERGGVAVVGEIQKPNISFNSITEVFDQFLKHEQMVTQKIHDIVAICLEEKDHATNNFMQWFVSEQIEEEALVRTLIDKLRLIGEEKSGLYFFDRDLLSVKTPDVTINNNA